MRFGICNELFEGWDLDRVFGAAREYGYDGVEIAPFTFGKPITDISPSERLRIRSSAESQGVSVVGLHWILAHTEGFHVNHPDEEVRDRTAVYLSDLAELCADIGGDVIVFGSPKQRNIEPGLSIEQAWDYAAETFSRVAPALEQTGVTLCLEPLGPEETDFINTAAEAMAMIERIDSPQFQLLLDVKAMSTEATPIEQIIRDSAHILRHFHANDANRRGPGFGDTDFRPIARALEAIGYEGWVSVEVFDFGPDPVTVASRSMDYLRRVFA